MKIKRPTWPNVRSLMLMVTGVLTAAAVLAYANTGAVTAAVTGPSGHAQKLAPSEKLKQAREKCRKDKTKKQRNACERKAHRLYGSEKPEVSTHETTTTTTGTATTTGTYTTTGTGTTGTGATTGTIGTEGEGAAHDQYPSPRVGKNTVTELEKAKVASETPSASQVAGGKEVFETTCEVCHGAKGEGEVGDNFVPYRFLPRAQSVVGVIEQLVEPLGGAPEFELMTFAQKEEAADYVCVELTQKCAEG